SPADPLAGAPQTWPDFLAWAGQQLDKTPAPVPLPDNPRLPTPRWTAIRLEELLAGASIRSDWEPPPTGAETLATLGPFRSDQPGDTLGVQSLDRSDQPRLRLTISGLKLAREDVGAIAIELRQPFGAHFDLIWSQAGRIRVPVPDNQRFWTLNVATDGLADWTGPLTRIALDVGGTGPGIVEIRSIRFLRREHSFPEPVGLRRVSLDREARSALYMHVPAEVKFPPIVLPTRARLQLGLGLVAATAGDKAPDGRAGATEVDTATHFDVSFEYEGRRTTILSRSLQEADGWADATVSLEAWAGKTVSPILKASRDGPADVACWGNPVVYETVENPPCVIIYLIDALAAKHIDLYGYRRKTMPRLTALAGRGVWFSNAWANSPRTVESVPDLMLSLTTERHEVYHPSAAAPSELVTLPEALRAAGFATASFCTNVNAGPRQNMDQGFDHFFDRIAYWWTGEADRTVPLDAVMGWLATHRDRPTFLYIHTAEPHAPYTPPPGYAGRFDPDYDGQIDGTYDKQHGFRKSKTLRDVQHVVALYNEEIFYADARLGAFLDALADQAHLASTNIFVTADHGEAFGEHGAWEHGNHLYGELLRIPLVTTGPLVTARGRQDVPVQLYDLMPTILAMFDLPTPYPLAGRSLLPLLVRPSSGIAAPASDRAATGPGSRLAEQRTIFASNHGYRNRALFQHAVREGRRWKLMCRHQKKQTPDGSAETKFLLYDLASDPHEQADVIDAHHDVARRLIGRLLQWQGQQAPFEAGGNRGQVHLDAEQLEELRSLGYIE
ncbi:MAG: sulfatase, partial [Planctomycetota bacterium]